MDLKECKSETPQSSSNWIKKRDLISKASKGPEDLRGHDETRRLRTDLDVACQESYVSEGVFKVSELLIGQSFDRRGVDGPVTTPDH